MKFLFRVQVKYDMFLTSQKLEVLFLLFSQTLQNVVEAINVVSSRSDFPDLTAATRSPIVITVALDALLVVE